MLRSDLIPTPLVPEAERTPLPVHPVRPPRWGDTVRVGALMTWVVIKMIWLVARRRDVPAAARLFRGTLEDLGGVWLKLGQVLAMRTDVLPAAFCRELVHLHERARAFESAAVRRIIAEQLGGPVENFFDAFEEQPLAAASFAQVHRAVLRENGVRVAIKVKRPHAAQYFQRDYRVLRAFLWTFRVLQIAPHMRWHEMLGEIDTMIRQELDYRFEAFALKRHRKLLKAHKVYAPKPFERHCTTDVLVMEYLPGVSASALIVCLQRDPARAEAWLEENGISRKRLASRLLQSIFRQLFEDNLYHGDLHPGNVLILRDSRIALIDFGSVAISDAQLVGLYDQFLRALMESRLTLAADLQLLMIGKLPPLDVDETRRQLVTVMTAWNNRAVIKSAPFSEKSLTRSSEDIGKILMAHKISANWAMLRLGRTLATLDMTIGAVYPEIEYPKVIAGYFMKKQRRTNLRRVLGLPRALQTAADFADVILPMLRDRALTVGGFASSLSTFLMFITRTLTVGFAIGVVAFTLAYLHRHHTGLREFLGAEDSWFVKFQASLPNWGRHTEIIFALGLTGVLLFALAALQAMKSAANIRQRS